MTAMSLVLMALNYSVQCCGSTHRHDSHKSFQKIC